MTVFQEDIAAYGHAVTANVMLYILCSAYKQGWKDGVVLGLRSI